MNDQSVPNPTELGRHLTLVRERSGLRQAELAKQVSLSQAVLSRIESGDRPVTTEEVKDILSAIGTPEALVLSKALDRAWTILPRPPLDHRDQELLWNAEQVAIELSLLRDRPETPHAFERRLTDYIEELKRCAANLLKREHQVAFIGSIGAGKSTAICRMTGLMTPKDDGTPMPVLEVGGGGVTVCEVHLRTGPEYGLIIEPRSDEQIRNDVADLADHVYKVTDLDDEDAGSDSQGISKEVARALRNMADLAVRRRKAPDGKRIAEDPAKELAKQLSSQRDFIVEVLARMGLHRRDRRDVWFDSASGLAPKAWLRDTFMSINNGRHPEFTLPKRIEVVVPEQLLDVSDLTVRLIDTKGIDRTSAREDIECHFHDPHTLAVLCTAFNNAGSGQERILLERARDSGVRTLELNAALLALPRAGEALAMKDDATGISVDAVDEGYELKQEQVELALEPIGLQRMAVGFYNAHEDPPSSARDFLAARLRSARESFRDRIQATTSGAKSVLENYEKEQVRAVLRDTSEQIRAWIGLNREPKKTGAHVQQSLLAEIKNAYAATVRATVRRDGEWENLSYMHHIGYGSRRLAVLALGQSVDDFLGHCKLLRAMPRFADAADLIEQSSRVLSNAYEDLLRKVQIMGQTSFKDALKNSPEFWQACTNEWGQGPGYKGRVAEHNNDWFDDETRRSLEDEIKALIQREWIRVLAEVEGLLEPA